MVHLPVRGPDPYDTFFPFAFGGLFAPFRDSCPDTIIDIYLALLGLLRHLLLRWYHPPFQLEHCLNKDLAINYITL
jgi:hypothetical protein